MRYCETSETKVEGQIRGAIQKQEREIKKNVLHIKIMKD